jgi:hypothetical protein
MPKGCKSCSSCGFCTGPRAYVCPQCHTPFAFKVQSKEKKNTKIIRDFNWRELISGDRIKVTGGPYYMNRDQEFVPMGYRGKFVVQKIDNNGIVAYSDKGGFCHIYMGPDMQCGETKIWKTKHKLLKLKTKEKNYESVS